MTLNTPPVRELTPPPVFASARGVADDLDLVERHHRGRAYWLPLHGFCDVLPAVSWAEIADPSEEELPKVLFALAEVEVAAYVVTVHSTPVRPVRGDTGSIYRLRVNTLH